MSQGTKRPREESVVEGEPDSKRQRQVQGIGLQPSAHRRVSQSPPRGASPPPLEGSNYENMSADELRLRFVCNPRRIAVDLFRDCRLAATDRVMAAFQEAVPGTDNDPQRVREWIERMQKENLALRDQLGETKKRCARSLRILRNLALIVACCHIAGTAKS